MICSKAITNDCSQASMARVMCDNTDIENAQPSMFLLPGRGNLVVNCGSQRISRVNLDVFKEESGSTSKPSRDPRRNDNSAVRGKSSSFEGELASSFLG